MACTYAIVVTQSVRRARQLCSNGRSMKWTDRLTDESLQKTSALSKINREAQEREAEVERELFDFIDLCLEYSRVSDGAFDITVGRLMKAWGSLMAILGFPPIRSALSSRRHRLQARHPGQVPSNDSLCATRD